jgi:EpsI family protein
MKTSRIAVVLTGLMVFASIGGWAARPSAKAVDRGNKVVLEEIVPRQFGQWRELEQRRAQVVNPQTKALLDKLYSQTLSRTYVDASGYEVMLSLAYGDDQRGDLQAHKPEVCYPAQGHTVHSNVPGAVATPFGTIAARRLGTSYGRTQEPVTYWFTIGDRAVGSKFEKRLVEIRLGLTGQIPDGLLFRVSSYDPNAAHAFQLQDSFVADLLKAVPQRDRARLSGLSAAAPS